MKITFCGHSRIDFSDYNKSFLKELLIECIIKDPQSIFYLGGYGDFDSICLNILKELQLTFKDIKIIFVTPYIDRKYYKLEYAKEYFDEIVFPPLENVPRKFAIIRRNEWMVDNSDIVIAYVQCSYGGAARTLDYAKHKNKNYINIAL